MRQDSAHRVGEIERLKAENASKEQQIRELYEQQSGWEIRRASNPALAEFSEAKINDCKLRIGLLAQQVQDNKAIIRKHEAAIHETRQSKLL